jgi:hypothetical protein
MLVVAFYMLSKNANIPGSLTENPRQESFDQWSSDLECFEYGSMEKLSNSISLIQHAIFLNWNYRFKPVLLCIIGNIAQGKTTAE